MAAGALLGACCLLVGAVFGTGGRGRVRAYGAALASWLVLVFVLDAVLLGIVLATAPPPPGSVGHHGHDEIAAVASDEDEAPAAPSLVWMAAGPVDLFRLTAPSPPGLAPRATVVIDAVSRHRDGELAGFDLLDLGRLVPSFL